MGGEPGRVARHPGSPPRPRSRAAAPDLADRVDALLARFSVRLFLSVAILLSLVPHGEAAWLDVLFLVVFGVEFVARAYVFVDSFRDRDDADSEVRRARRRLNALAFLVVDLLALLSFVPWPHGPTDGRWLRLFRLTRMLLLVGYWSPIARDFWSVLTRRERMRQFLLLGTVVLLLAFAGGAILEHIAAGGVDFNGDGTLDAADEQFLARIWWSFRQVQDAGNLIATPFEVAALVISLLLTLAGVFLISFLIGLAADVVRELVELGDSRPVGFVDHTVVVHTGPSLPRLLRELISFHDKLFRRPRLAVVGSTVEPPPALRASDLSAIRWRAQGERGEGLVERADVATARRVVVLACPDEPDPDAHTASLLLTLRESNPDAWITAEILEQRNASAARVAGGPRTILAPTEKLLALYVALAIRRPERVPIFRELLTSRGGSEVYTYFYDMPGYQDPRGVLPARATLRFDALYRRALTSSSGAHVVPIGLVYVDDGPDVADNVHGRLCIRGRRGPRPGTNASVRGVVAVAHDFDALRRFATSLHDPVESRAAAASAPAELEPPAFLPAPTATNLERVVILGFRPAVVDLCAALMADAPDVDIQLIVSDTTLCERARRAFSEHSVHIRAGLWQEHGPWGTFAAHAGEDDDALTWCAEDAAPGAGRLCIDVADWTSERTLLALPRSGRHIGSVDLAVLLGGPSADVDQRTAMTTLKIADILRAHPERFGPDFRLVAAVGDRDLGRRLAEAYRRAAAPHRGGITTFPVDDLRALFTFQSVAVAAFDAIYSELLSPWGESFVRLTPAHSDSDARWTFTELAFSLLPDRVLVAVDVRDADGNVRRLIGSAPDADGPERFSQRDLDAAWVLDG